MQYRLGMAALLWSSSLLWACTYCDPNSLKTSTFRQEARSAKLVAVVRPTNPRLVGEQGVTDLVIEQLIKNDSKQQDPKMILLQRWIPVDPKKPLSLLIFADAVPQFDPYRGVPLKGNEVAGYLQKAMKLDELDRMAMLKFYFGYLDHADPDIAADAFLEFAKATDQEVADVSKQLDVKKIRELITNPKTPIERIGLYGFLLGAAGTSNDTALLTKLIQQCDAERSAALGGLLGGLISLDANVGWKTTISIIENDQSPYQHKLAAMGTLRFFQVCQPKLYRTQIITGMKAIVQRGDMADMAIEDLRRWKWWDLTSTIVEQYGKSTHTAPLVKHAILRYALTCQDEQSMKLVASVKANDPKLIEELIEATQLEKTPPAGKSR